MVPNAPKWYEMQQNYSLGSNGVDRVCSLPKIPTRHPGTNFGTSSARFAPSFVGQPNGLHPNSMKCSKMSVFGTMVWIGCVRCEKFRHDFVARTFALVRLVLHRVFKATKQSRMHPKQYKTHQNISLGSNWVDRVRLLRKCTQIVRNAPKCQFRIQWVGSGAFVLKNSDATSWHELLHQFAPFCTEFFVRQPNTPKCTQIV